MMVSLRGLGFASSGLDDAMQRPIAAVLSTDAVKL